MWNRSFLAAHATYPAPSSASRACICVCVPWNKNAASRRHCLFIHVVTSCKVKDDVSPTHTQLKKNTRTHTHTHFLDHRLPHRSNPKRSSKILVFGTSFPPPFRTTDTFLALTSATFSSDTRERVCQSEDVVYLRFNAARAILMSPF